MPWQMKMIGSLHNAYILVCETFVLGMCGMGKEKIWVWVVPFTAVDGVVVWYTTVAPLGCCLPKSPRIANQYYTPNRNREEKDSPLAFLTEKWSNGEDETNNLTQSHALMKNGNHGRNGGERRLLLPNASPSMPGAFRDGKEHEVMVSWCCDGSVLRPVVRKIMDQFPPTSIHHWFLSNPIWVVWGTHQFNVRLVFIIKTVSITCPLVEP